MGNFILIAGYLLIGLLLHRSRQFPQNTGQILNAYVIYVALPALVLQKIPFLHISPQLLIPALTPWLLLALTVPLILWLSRRLQWSRGTTGAMLIIVLLGNTSFVGFPIVEAFFGSAGIPYAQRSRVSCSRTIIMPRGREKCQATIHQINCGNGDWSGEGRQRLQTNLRTTSIEKIRKSN